MADAAQEIVRQFAVALDHDAFDAARPLLAPDCTYHIGNDNFQGPDAILESYESATRDAHATFDRVEYDSSIQALSDGRIAVDYTDRLTHAGRVHVHRCRQVCRVTDAGLIAHIEHIDLPGEREAVEAFRKHVGLPSRD